MPALNTRNLRRAMVAKAESLRRKSTHVFPPEKGFNVNARGPLGLPGRRFLRRLLIAYGHKPSSSLTPEVRAWLIPPAPKSVGEKAVDLMESWAAAGWRESPAYSNKVPPLEAFAAKHGLSTWYQAMGWPWCAFAGMLALYASGSSTAHAGIAGKFNALYTVDIYNKAKLGLYGMRVVPRAQVGRGLIGLLDEPGGAIVDHFIMTRGRIVLGLVRTVEGNTIAEGSSGSDSNGGQMACRIRRASTITFVSVA